MAKQKIIDEKSALTPEESAAQAAHDVRIAINEGEEEHEAPTDTGDLKIGRGYDSIVTTLFEEDTTEETVSKIENFLTLTSRASAAEYGTLVDTLDEAQEMVRQALRILIGARVRVKLYKVDIDVIEGAHWRDAENLVAAELKDPDHPRSAKPTKDSIKAMMDTEFHDEVRATKRKRVEAESMIEYLEGLYKIIGERARDLRQMVGSVVRGS